MVINPSVLEAHGNEDGKRLFPGADMGINGKVPTAFFWGKPLPPRFKEDLYTEFKEYALRRIDKENNLSLDGPLRTPLEELKQTLRAAGLEKVAGSVEELRAKVRAAVLQDMDENKDSIVDGVELAILNRELPDRLIIYHTVLQDEQVHAAFELVSGRALPRGVVQDREDTQQASYRGTSTLDAVREATAGESGPAAGLSAVSGRGRGRGTPTSSISTTSATSRGIEGGTVDYDSLLSGETGI